MVNKSCLALEQDFKQKSNEMDKTVKTVNGKLLTPTRLRVGRHLTPLGYRRNACTSFATTRSFAHELLELLAQNLQV